MILILEKNYIEKVFALVEVEKNLKDVVGINIIINYYIMEDSKNIYTKTFEITKLFSKNLKNSLEIIFNL